FTVQGGKVINPERLHIDLSEKASNVAGSVVKNGKPVVGDWVTARTVSGESLWFNGKIDENGNFGLNLPDGDFVIEGIWVDEEQKWYPLNLNFSVKAGVLQGQSELVIDLGGEQDLNVKGSISNENGKVENVDISIKSVVTGEYFYTSTNENGDFGLQLVDGHYKIELVVVDGQLYTPIYLDKEFSIAGGKLQIAGVDAKSLDVTLPQLSLNVQLIKDEEPLKNIEVEIVQSNKDGARYIYKDVDQNGVASLRLQDGEYRVGGYYDSEDKFYYLDEPVTISNGTTSPNPFIIDVTTTNLTKVQGSLSDSNGFVGNARITFYNETIEDIFVTNVNSEGSYSADLPDGEYSIESIYSDAFNYAYDVKINSGDNRFTIREGAVSVNGDEIESLEVTIPTESLKVQILNNGVPVKGSLLIFNDDESWYASTNVNGELNLRVPTGEYTIYSFDTEDNTYPINKIVTANNESPEIVIIDLAIPGDGIVSGVVMDGDTLVVNSEFVIQNITDYSGYYTVLTDENGRFSADIPDGDYVIEDITDTNWNPIASVDLLFSVKNGNIIVDGKTVDELTLNLPPESLHVQILNNETPLLGEVDIRKMISGYEISYITNLDENGEFTLRVPDGIYTISGLYEMDPPYDWYIINQDVEVLNGTTTPNPFVIDLDLETSNIGIVQDENGPLSGGFVELKDSEGDWHSFDVDENGEFLIDLHDGNYVVKGYYSETIGDVALETHFSIQDGVLFVNGNASNQLIITLPTVTVVGAVTEDNGTVGQGKIGILDLNDDDPYSRYYVVDQSGNFSLRLLDGEYLVTAITQNNPGYVSIPMHVSFSVQEGALYVNGAAYDTLNLLLPQLNFTGQVVQSGEPLGDSTIHLLSELLQGFYQGFTVGTDGDGFFSHRLGDGNYEITGVEWLNEYFNKFIEFEVLDGVPSIDLSIFEMSEIYGNVQGLVQAEDVSLLEGGAFLYFENTANPGDWDYTDVNSKGEFGLQLPDGNYTVVQFYSGEAGFIDLQVSFTVQNGELVEPLVVTLPNQ
ncbi:MSCRAMM family protein, partial [Bacillus sp. JJ1562]|uniref:MSCRAMM family protein n=1 Tax=Bacillus sp. JJ1562 TaxID=3122960 RepID=UPI0030036DC8